MHPKEREVRRLENQREAILRKTKNPLSNSKLMFLDNRCNQLWQELTEIYREG